MSQVVSYPMDRKITLVGETVTVEGQLKEISLRSVGVESPVKARVGTRLKLVFEIPALGYFQTLSPYGIVTHLHNTNTNGGAYYLGIEYEQLTVDEQVYLQDFMAYKQRLQDQGRKKYSTSMH